MDKLLRNKQRMLRAEVLHFLEYEEIVKFALLCRNSLVIADPNRYTVKTDNFLNITSRHQQIERHLHAIVNDERVYLIKDLRHF